MNTKRIVLGGLVAGLVMTCLDFVTSVPLYGAEWAAVYRAYGLSLQGPAVPIFWVAYDFLGGLLIAFLYAAMRPRLGAGPSTAIVAALVMSGVCHATQLGHIADGLFPAALLLKCCALELLSACLGGIAAGFLYTEPASA